MLPFLLAETSATDYIFQGTALTAVLVAFGVIIRWMLNRFDSTLDQIVQTQRIHTVTILNLQQQILIHDLTVSGLNPATGADFDERDSKAFTRYAAIQEGMEDLKKMIQEQK